MPDNFIITDMATAKKARKRSQTTRPVEIATDVESRGSRRKRETRARLLEAAFRLMAERGADAVSINEITEAADVGFGSFYNHFKSREAIYTAVIDAFFEEFADALDRLTCDVDDAAEVISISIRHTLQRARRELLWARFLMREAMTPHLMTHGLGVRLMRDIQKGIDQGRFKMPDPVMSFFAVSGGVVASITAELQLETGQSDIARKYGLGGPDVPERVASVMLHVLGLTFKQAEAIVQRPLPDIRDVLAAEDPKLTAAPARR